MRFKQWLEIATNAKGEDMNPSGTANATQQAVNVAMQDPSAAEFQTSFQQQKGSPSKQVSSFFDFGNDAIKNLPQNVLQKTSPNHILHGMQQAMGVKNNSLVRKPSFMKKKMKKKMEKE